MLAVNDLGSQFGPLLQAFADRSKRTGECENHSDLDLLLGEGLGRVNDHKGQKDQKDEHCYVSNFHNIFPPFQFKNSLFRHLLLI
jgi:hypothetical protein